jgi:hypothetical protein
MFYLENVDCKSSRIISLHIIDTGKKFWFLQARGWTREPGKDRSNCILFRMGKGMEERHISGSYSEAFRRDWWRWNNSTNWNVFPPNWPRVSRNDGNWCSHPEGSFSNANEGGSDKAKYWL